jgi:hypothetical protein
VQHRWALGHKEGWPLPKEKVVVRRKAQLRILFEACDLGFHSGELTLKSREVSLRTRHPFRLLGFHNAPHVRSHAIAPPEGNARQCGWR